MASIRRETLIGAPASQVWAAVREVNAPHLRLMPGLVTDATLEGRSRVLTFATGEIVWELIVDVDDATRRFCYAVMEGSLPIIHHNSSLQVFPGGEESCRLVWHSDVFPDDAAGQVGELMDQCAAVMKQTLESEAAARMAGREGGGPPQHP